MASFNQSIFMGRLTADVELKQNATGMSVAGFSLAIDRPKKTDGTPQEADFFNFKSFGATAEFIARFFRKGSPILVVCEARVNKWTDRSGANRSAVEFLVNRALFCESKAAQDAQKTKPLVDNGADFEEVAPSSKDDSDLPF